MSKGINDELYNRFCELCEVLNISPLAQSALGDMLYEAFYAGHDSAIKEKLGDLQWRSKNK